MTKFFLVKLELPDWADQPEQLENVRSEIEQHAGAAAAFYTRATHITARCELAKDKLGVLNRLHTLEP